MALLFASVDSGEDYIIVGGNEGDRVDAPSFLDKDCEWILIILFFRNILTARHGGDALVAAQNNNTSVIVNGVGLLIIEAWNQWKNHPNVTAVCILLPLYLFTNFKNPRQVASVWAGLSGSEVGNSYWRISCTVFGTHLEDYHTRSRRALGIILPKWLLVEKRVKYWASRILKGKSFWILWRYGCTYCLVVYWLQTFRCCTFFFKRNFGGLNFFTLQKIFTPSFRIWIRIELHYFRL